MRRSLLLAATIALVFAGVAAAATYKAGRYEAGSSSKDGISLRIKHGSFSVARVSFIETCTNPDRSFTDRFQFLKGSNAKLDGKINKKRHLSGSYSSDAGVVKVTGTVKGSKATVKVTESGSFTAEDGQTYDCAGSHTFHAKRLVVSTQGGG
jgi:hypothetical protein